MPVDKDWFTMAVSLLSEYSNSKDIGIRSRTHVFRKHLCHELQHNFFSDSQIHIRVYQRNDTPQNCPKGDEQPVNRIMDLANLVYKKVRKDLWKLGCDVILTNRLLVNLYSSLTVELVGTLTL